MQSFLLVTLSLLALGRAFAEPIQPISARTDDSSSCLTEAQAQTVANNFRALIADYSESFTNETLTVDFVDYSDSVNELINNGCTNGPAPLGSPTFNSRAEFIAGQGQQPLIDFQILNVWHACEAVFVRWKSAQTPQLVTGIIALEVVKATSGSQPWLIKTVYSEFNSGAWLVNLGLFKPTCSTPSPPPGAGDSCANSTVTHSRLRIRYSA